MNIINNTHQINKSFQQTTFNSIPEDLLSTVISYLRNPLSLSSTTKNIKQCNCIHLGEAWSELENLSKKLPLLAAYLGEIPTDKSSDQKFKALYRLMIEDVHSFNQNERSTLSHIDTTKLSDQKFNPKLYLELAQKIEDISLQKVWPNICTELPPPSPLPEDAPIEDIRTYLNDPSNKEKIGTIHRLFLIHVNLITLPQEIRKLTKVKKITLVKNNLCILSNNIRKDLEQSNLGHLLRPLSEGIQTE